MNIDKIIDELALQIDKTRMIQDAPMKEYTSFKAGGKAALLVKPYSANELSYALSVLKNGDIPHMVIGNGTNLLVKDTGYNGVLIKIGEGFQEISVSGDRIEAGAGASLYAVANEACIASLTGFEFASGIPGTIGGAVFMNAGAYDGEISQILESAEILSADGTRIFTMTKDDLNLSYRSSILQNTGDILLKANFRLTGGEQNEISDRMKELAIRRNEKQPLDYPSAGSFFKRPKGHFAGKLIQDAGLRGLTVGGAQVSALHAGFIINTGTATASDIINLMEIVRATVYEESGVLLEPEVRIIG